MALENPEAAALNAGLLLQQFRERGDLVIHIRHNYEPGGEIHSFVKPLDSELVISKDKVNAFLDTELEEVLEKNEITDLVICGMQTHMCVEAAVRAGADKGYKCTLVDDACATRPLQYGSTIVPANYVHASTLASLKAYAKIMTTSDFLIKMAETRE